MDDLEKIIPDFAKGRGNKLTAILIVLLLTSSVIIVSLLVAIIVVTIKSQQPTSAGCVSPGCLSTSSVMLASMDPTAKPCDDFYRYACGGWLRENPLPPNTYQVSVRTHMWLKRQERLREALEAPDGSKDITTTEKKLKTFYRVCLQGDARSGSRGKPLADIIRGKMQGWYVIDPNGWSRGWSLHDALAVMMGDFLVPAFFGFTVLWDPRDPTRNLLEVYPGGFGGNFDNYYAVYSLQPEDESDYKKFMRTVGELLIRDAGLSISSTQTKQRLDIFVSDAYAVETYLSNITQEAGDLWSLETTTLGEMKVNFSEIDYVQLFGNIFKSSNLGPNTEVTINSKKYFAQLNLWLRGKGSIESRMVNNYMVWRLAASYAPHLSWEYIQAAYAFRRKYLGILEPPDRWKRCMDYMEPRFTEGLAAEYVRTHLGEGDKDKVDTIFRSVRGALTSSLTRIQWMDEVTSKRAKEKISKMTDIIGYPDYIADDKKMDLLYSTWTVNETAGYFVNLLSANKWRLEDMARKLREPVKNERFQWTALHPYIWYDTYFNEMIVSPVAKQAPFFDGKRPIYVNFGAMGRWMGGSMINSIAFWGWSRWWNHTQWMWWTNYTTYAFQDQRQCLADYYSSQKAGPYMVDSKNVTYPLNGGMYVWEAVRKVVGYRLALQAYRDFLSQSGRQLELPAVGLTNEQSLFLAAVQTECTNRNDAKMAELGVVPTDVGVNGALRQLPEFAEVFQCPAGSSMVLQKPCNIF